eukprot:TRINITY_DN289_c0_g5_i1.p1 TRINITY_DN289_c0_g5~~TRINITY_DN289_c0_g5_i1.p1  ORF type:complete len:542 (-),score=44.97 TRINITY_DN289_c0_g5_i1:229-1854(-)
MASHLATRIKSVAAEAWSWWWEVSNEKDQIAKVTLTFSIVLLLVSWCHAWMNGKWKKGSLRLPPGPRGLPLVGSLPFLDPDLHRYFAKQAGAYGPIFKLQLGTKTCIVISSPSMAKEVLRDNDAIFANRDLTAAASLISYGGLDMAFAPYGPDWRLQRKVCAKELLSKTSLDAVYGLRRSEVRESIRYVYTNAEMPINVGDQIFTMMLNLILNVLWGGRLKGEEKIRVGRECREVMRTMSEIMGEPNISDFFPIIAPLDLQGTKRRMRKILLWFDGIFVSVLNQREKMDLQDDQRQGKKEESYDFLQLLLRLKNDGNAETPLTLNHLKALLLDIVAGATETSTTSIEWAMTEMMQHPQIMRRVQEELEEVVGLNSVVDESHLPKLHYLNAVVKEVHRLHPVLPLLVPRQPSQSCTVGGYTVPQDARVMINVWAIHRDPTVWNDPLEFQPERFLKSMDEKWDYSGNDYRYLPFGSGRRICVGVPMVERILPYALASFVHSFEWCLPEGETLHLSDKFGITLKKEKPLVAIPYPRLSNPQLYS